MIAKGGEIFFGVRSMWKMINETNAIDVMAIQFRFSEPLNTVLARRVQTELDTSTSKSGLIDRIPMQGFRVNMANPSQVENVTGTGMVYQRTSVVRNNDGAVEKALTAQVEFQPSHITYQTWTYSNWAKEKNNALEILVPSLTRALQAVPISAIRVEYMDRMYFDGNQTELRVNDVLNENSDLLARHVFMTPFLWHSHTGRFASQGQTERKLLIVNADLQVASAPHIHAGKTCVQLVTAAEKQYADPGYEFTGNDTGEFLSTVVDELHSDALKIFADVLNEQFAKQNGLPL